MLVVEVDDIRYKALERFLHHLLMIRVTK